ncbi:MAG: hypothetical protein HBSAPP04_02530 [Ignavibacteriaceae bacterium]|nr:MAG: hypothetical protein HBSAPP04_02530 [Ignavibacteriaceae bacterium]
MGQQQLLLIALGVIIVGIAVVTGINLFQQNSDENKKYQMIAECTTLAGMAQNYYMTPIPMGGGGKSFVGWVIPQTLDTTEDAIYRIVSASQSQVTISATDRAISTGDDTIKVLVTTYPDNYVISTGN